MGSVQDVIKCPKCGHKTFTRDYYYRSDEEYCFCCTCGYQRNYYFKRDDQHNPIRIIKNKYDLNESNVIFGMAKYDEQNKIRIIASKRITPSDTEEDIRIFLNLGGYSSSSKEFQRNSTCLKRLTMTYCSIFL